MVDPEDNFRKRYVDEYLSTESFPPVNHTAIIPGFPSLSFTGEVGGSMVERFVRCPYCDQRNKVDALDCGFCGGRLGEIYHKLEML